MPPAPLAAAPHGVKDASGAPRLGAFAGELPDVDLGALAAPGLAGRLSRLLRGKRWIYALAVSEEVLAALAIVEAGWFAGGFAWVLDRRTGAVLREESATGLPGRNVSVAASARDGARATLRTGALALGIAREGARWRLTGESRRRSSGAGAFALDASLEVGAAPPFGLVVPVPGGGVRATQKAAAFAASGAVRVGTRSLSLAGGAGGVDFTAGLLARETSWRWAFGTGRAAGAPIGFNLCAGFGVPAGEPGENAGFGAGAPWRLPPVAFEVGGARGAWRIASAGGEVGLVFRPEGAHREARNLGVVRTRFVQVGGTFEGRVAGPGGEAIAIAGLSGVVEDHRAVW